MAITNVTKKQFEEAYRKFPPSKCEIFYIKNVSIASMDNNFKYVILIFIGLIFPFAVTIISKIQFINFPPCIFSFLSIFYVYILALIGVYSFIIWYKKRKRIQNIINELHITLDEYHELIRTYYYENYYLDLKDYINKIIEDSE